MSRLSERMHRLSWGEDWTRHYQSNPGHTLVWTHAYPMAWRREDGVKVVQHLSPPGEWAIADTRVHAHTGWYFSEFDAMDAADVLLGDQRED